MAQVSLSRDCFGVKRPYVVSMATYRPGHGLSRDSTERLRARKLEQVGVGSKLPAVDESKQWDSLLGVGAQKKPRCGICTRPLSHEEWAGGQPICPRCHSASAKEAPRTKPRGRACASASVACATPSTRLASEYSGGTASNSPRSVNTPELAEQEVKPPTSEDVWLTVLKRGLEGEWIGQEGETYKVRFRDDTCFTCEFRVGGQARTVMLHADTDSNLIVWGAEGSHSLDASEICGASAEITWRPYKATCHASEMCWQRRRPNTDHPKVQTWQPSLRADASAFVPTARRSTGDNVSTCRSTALRAEAYPFTPSLRAEAHPFVPSLRAEACPFVPVSERCTTRALGL